MFDQRGQNVGVQINALDEGAPSYWLDTCPVCDGIAVMACKCPVNERTCDQGHTWYWRDRQKVVGSWHNTQK
jgi:hypothetical protein